MRLATCAAKRGSQRARRVAVEPKSLGATHREHAVDRLVAEHRRGGERRHRVALAGGLDHPLLGGPAQQRSPRAHVEERRTRIAPRWTTRSERASDAIRPSARRWPRRRRPCRARRRATDRAPRGRRAPRWSRSPPGRRAGAPPTAPASFSTPPTRGAPRGA